MSRRKVPMTLTYAGSGVQPPIFLAGSFTEPAWHPQEMDYTTNGNGDHEFKKEVMVDEGSQYQYKYRIGTGDWWALNEQAPIVTDSVGNRNNLLNVPMAEESFSESSYSDFVPTPPEPQSSIPELVVEKVDPAPRHGDDFGDDATIGQKIAHQKRAADAEPDVVIIRSATGTPVYARTAAEVADSAAILDREASPVQPSDEEAGRTGERRMSSTPIPQVAMTASEVADSAAIIDGDDKSVDMSGLWSFQESASAQATSGHDTVPLFAHECLGPAESDDKIFSEEAHHEEESQYLIPPEREDVIDSNDLLLEEFPSDRMSILTHIRSTESRLSQDETNFDGIPASPIARAKSRSPIIETLPSTKLDAQPSPQLEVITEEHQELGLGFSKLPSPGREKDLNDIEEVAEIEDVEEVKEPVEVDKLADIEEPKEPDDVKFYGITKNGRSVQAEERKDSNNSKMEDPADTDMPGEVGGPKEVEDTKESEVSAVIEKSDIRVDVPRDGNLKEAEINQHVEQLNDSSIEVEKPKEAGEVVVKPVRIERQVRIEATKAKSIEASPAMIATEDSKEEPENLKVAEMGQYVDHLKGDSKILKVALETQPAHKPGESKDLVTLNEVLGPAKTVEPQQTDEPQEKPDQREAINSPGVERSKAVKEHLEKTAGVEELEWRDKSQGKEKPKEADIPESVSIDGAAIGGAAIGGAVAAELIYKNISPDPTVGAQDVEETPDLHKDISDHSIIKPSPQQLAEVFKGPSIAPLAASSTTEAPIAETPITEHLSDAISPQSHIRTMVPIDAKPKQLDQPPPNGTETAKSSSLEDPISSGRSDSHLKMRNTPSDRPLTPASIHSTIKNSNSRNFFQALWRTVFVGWIGGLFAKLWGGGSGSLLTFSAIVLLALAPVLYFAQLL